MESMAMTRCQLLALLLCRTVLSEGVARAQTAEPTPPSSIWNRFAKGPSVGISSGYLSGQAAGKDDSREPNRRQTPPLPAECGPCVKGARRHRSAAAGAAASTRSRRLPPPAGAGTQAGGNGRALTAHFFLVKAFSGGQIPPGAGDLPPFNSQVDLRPACDRAGISPD